MMGEENVVMTRLAPGVFWLWMISSSIWAVVVLVGSVVGEFYMRGSRPDWWPMGGLVGVSQLVLVVPGYVLSAMSYRRWGYAIRERDVLIESGVIWRVRRSIPRTRVQHVDIRSGPVERAMGLVQVDMHTAGSMGPVASIPGLTPMAAEDLREVLIGDSQRPSGEAADGV